MLIRAIHGVCALAAMGCLSACSGGGGGGSPSGAATGTSVPQPTPAPPSAAAPPPPPTSVAPIPSDDSPILFSHLSDLSHAAPIDGSRQAPGITHVFLRPDSNWKQKPISQVLFRCCDRSNDSPLGLGSPGALRATAEPWSTAIDLTGLSGGSQGRLETRAFFTDGSSSDVAVSQFTIEAADGNNAKPRLAGSAPGSAVVGRYYRYRPSARDADGDPLGFSVQNRPSWLDFDSITGVLEGRPGWGDVGTNTGIAVVASDGQTSSEANPFAIRVEASVPGEVTLSWRPPSQRENGEPLSNLAGYRLLFGQRSERYDEDIYIDSPGITTYTVENLLAGSWYFVMTAVDRDGLESGYSAEIERTIP